MGAIAAVANLLFGFPWLAALLLGAALSGTASSNVIPMMARSGASEKTKAILAIESTITDAFTLIVGLAILDMMVGNGDVSGAPAKLMGSITSAAFIGVILSGLWVIVLHKLPTMKYSYMLTLAAVFIAYALSEFFGGNGVIAVFVFGLILGNSERIAALFNLDRKLYGLDPEIRRMQEEISFLVRTFFFVYLGLLMIGSTFKETAIFLSVAIVVVSLAARWFSVRVFASSIQSNECGLVAMMMPRGLAAAVLVTIPASKGIVIPYFSETIIISILLTNIVATIGLFIYNRSGNDSSETDAQPVDAGKPRIIRTK
jgi:cell volume regulation protein A